MPRTAAHDAGDSRLRFLFVAANRRTRPHRSELQRSLRGERYVRAADGSAPPDRTARAGYAPVMLPALRLKQLPAVPSISVHRNYALATSATKQVLRRGNLAGLTLGRTMGQPK